MGLEVEVSRGTPFAPPPTVVLYVMTKSRRPLQARANGSHGSPQRDAISPVQAWIDDTFFRHIVAGMRNGVLAITRDGTLALINDEA